MRLVRKDERLEDQARVASTFQASSKGFEIFDHRHPDVGRVLTPSDEKPNPRLQVRALSR